jgi:hypothetical protein
MTAYEIPIIAAPFQRLQTTLNGITVGLVLAWNDWLGRWSLSVELDDVPVASGLRMVLGVDLIAGFGLGIGQLMLVDWAKKGGNPGYDELPSGEFRLINVVD